jgi:pyrroloquinoline quinone (PQQ) biosynthesis protein C
VSHSQAAYVEPLKYEAVDQVKLDELRRKHAWLVEPLYAASDLVAEMPFFRWVKELRTPQEFKCVAEQLYFHSATFPKVMGIMLGLTPMRENAMMPFYSKHAFGEADHHMLLRRWMRKHGLIASDAELDLVITSTETNACINLAYQLAIEQDRDKWLVTINSGIERCSNDFFKAVAPKMHELGAGDVYFDVHVEADEHHSIMGLEYLSDIDPASHRARTLLSKALEGVSLWASMIHAAIGMSVSPAFKLDGTLAASPKLI